MPPLLNFRMISPCFRQREGKCLKPTEDSVVETMLLSKVLKERQKVLLHEARHDYSTEC